MLEDRTLLRELEAELVVLLRPGAPDWADELGFDGDFGAHLRDYWAKHGQDQPEWLADENEVWDRLKKAGEANVDRRDRLEGWNHHVQISQDGQPAGTLRASCGQKLDLTASGWIQNNRGDSCIHQLMLVLDTSIVAELYDSVPGRNRPVNKNFSLVAPDAPGIYMLWRASDLQYSMRDARRNLENSHTRPNPAKFPGSFVAWLVVE
ncbi:unnamed protein product [Effrenium voratum]|uniref:Uncharacterized protein n=1 Tax=Effrenium voratum TaxID=2562239 RepID=A0AA36N7U0_9DINO|nr:unnamed protein product [Effrenium voratum]